MIPTMLFMMMTATSCIAQDGDTLNCLGEHVRLIGIDAPELPGHCRRGRDCAPGDPFASKAALQKMVQGKAVYLDRRGHDRYGRTLAFAYVDGVNLSCAQINGGFAIYKKQWDKGGVAARC